MVVLFLGLLERAGGFRLFVTPGAAPALGPTAPAAALSAPSVPATRVTAAPAAAGRRSARSAPAIANPGPASFSVKVPAPFGYLGQGLVLPGAGLIPQAHLEL